MSPADRRALPLIGEPMTIRARSGRPVAFVDDHPRPVARHDTAGRRMDLSLIHISTYHCASVGTESSMTGDTAWGASFGSFMACNAVLDSRSADNRVDQGEQSGEDQVGAAKNHRHEHRDEEHGGGCLLYTSGSPFFNMFRSIYISAFSPAEVEAFVTAAGQASGVNFDPVRAAINDLSGGCLLYTSRCV